MSQLEVGLDTSISVQVGVVTELEIERDVTGSASVAQESLILRMTTACQEIRVMAKAGLASPESPSTGNIL